MQVRKVIIGVALALGVSASAFAGQVVTDKIDFFNEGRSELNAIDVASSKEELAEYSKDGVLYLKADSKEDLKGIKKKYGKDVDVVVKKVKSDDKKAEIVGKEPKDKKIERKEFQGDNLAVTDSGDKEDSKEDSANDNNEALAKLLVDTVNKNAEIEQEKRGKRDIVIGNIDNGDVVIDGFQSSRASSIKEDYVPRSLREQSDYQLLDYTNDIENTVVTQTGYATVLEIPQGETITRVTLGDTQHFSVSALQDKGTGIWKIYLQPNMDRVATNMIVQTDLHMFNIKLVTGFSPRPFAKFINIPGRTVGSNVGFTVSEGDINLNVPSSKSLNFGYKRTGSKNYSWAPQNVFDDGVSHTYIGFERSALMKYRPVLLTKSQSGRLKLISYMRYKDYLVVDNVYSNIIVRIGNKEVNFVKKDAD